MCMASTIQCQKQLFLLQIFSWFDQWNLEIITVYIWFDFEFFSLLMKIFFIKKYFQMLFSENPWKMFSTWVLCVVGCKFYKFHFLNCTRKKNKQMVQSVLEVKIIALTEEFCLRTHYELSRKNVCKHVPLNYFLALNLFLNQFKRKILRRKLSYDWYRLSS